MKALLVHPQQTHRGVVIWCGHPDKVDLQKITNARDELIVLGYEFDLPWSIDHEDQHETSWFSRNHYEPKQGFSDFKRVFDFVAFTEVPIAISGDALGFVIQDYEMCGQYLEPYPISDRSAPF